MKNSYLLAAEGVFNTLRLAYSLPLCTSPLPMFVHLDLAVVFHLFCIVQGLSTAAYLLAGPRRPGNRWLGLLLLALTLQVVDYFLSRSGVYYRSRWLYFTPLFFSWGLGRCCWRTCGRCAVPGRYGGRTSGR